MSVYRTVNDNIKDIIDFILGNDELKVLLNNAEKDSLTIDPNTISLSDLMEKNIYPYPNISVPEDDVKSFISVYMNNGKNAGSGNVYQRDAVIFIDIMCHEQCWKLDNGFIRPLLILDNLDKNVPLLSTQAIRGSLSYKDTVYLQYNKKFCGYRLIYSVTNPSRGCQS